MKTLGGYITIKEFAKLTGVSIQAVHKAVKTGKRIKKVLRVAHVYLIHKSEVNKYKQKRFKEQS